MNRIIIISAIALLFLASCSGKKKVVGIHFENDMENSPCWSDAGTLTYGEGHTGKVFSKVTPELPYSFTFHKQLKDLSTKRVRKAEYSAWVKLSGASSEATIVLQIDSAGKTLFWVGNSTKLMGAPSDKWVQLKGKATLPMEVSRENEVKVYVWDNGKDVVLVDDLEVTFLDK